MALKMEDIRGMTKEELQNKVRSLREELFGMVFQARTGRIERPHRISALKKDVARCLTVMNEKGRV